MMKCVFRSIALLAIVLAACTQPDRGGTGSLAALTMAPGRSDLRIAVIGAGPSGLTAAYTLRKRGYKSVTVFEKEGRVGGKVHSKKIVGSTVELGAVFASPDYELVLGLADEYGIPRETYAGERFILDEKGRKLGFREFLLSRYTPAEIEAAIRNYAVALQNFSAIGQDGFAGLPSDLHLTFDVFAAKHGFTPIAEMAKSIMVGFGYGYYETVPAQYFMKLMPWLVKVGAGGLESPPYFTFPDGFQSLWEAVAGDLDVRLNTMVTRIERGKDGLVRLTINGSGRQEFDAVIISVPLNVVPRLMTLTDEEKRLFSQVETSRYFVTLFGALGIQGDGTVFVHDHARPEKINHVTVYASPGGGLPFYVGYQHAVPFMPAPLVTAFLAYDVHALTGGVFAGAVMRKEWEYFPRVGTAALDDGFYESMEALQGRNGIYYVGGTLSFETVEHAARYARTLVTNRFPVAALP